MDNGGRPSRVHVHVKRLFMGENGLDWRNPPPNVVAAADKINGLLEKRGVEGRHQQLQRVRTSNPTFRQSLLKKEQKIKQLLTDVVRHANSFHVCNIALQCRSEGPSWRQKRDVILGRAQHEKKRCYAIYVLPLERRIQSWVFQQNIERRASPPPGVREGVMDHGQTPTTGSGF